MKKIYIDVTQAYGWTGEAMGIIRVMDEISSRFINSTHFTPVFVIWEESLGLFKEVDYIQSLANRVNDGTELPTKTSEKAVLTKTKRNLRNIVRALPLTKTAYKVLLSRSDKADKYFNRTYSVRFEENAILFMPHGGVWESDLNCRRLLELRVEKNLKVVPIVYDMCPVLTPQFCSEGVRVIFNRYMRRALPNSDLILAISDNTAKDASKWLAQVSKRKPPLIKVFRLGDEIAEGKKPQKPTQELPSKFILCVGTVEARKNHTGLYYAYKLAVQAGLDLPPVVIAGRKGWHTEDFYEIATNDPDIKDKFIFLHNAPDEELAWLYQNALFSVYPSFYEGWGLPVAESLVRGLPCLASNTSSIPEIAGDIVEYFSPYSPAEIMRKIHEFNSNPKKLKAKTEQVKREYKSMKWDETFRQIETLLSSID